MLHANRGGQHVGKGVTLIDSEMAHTVQTQPQLAFPLPHPLARHAHDTLLLAGTACSDMVLYIKREFWLVTKTVQVMVEK